MPKPSKKVVAPKKQKVPIWLWGIIAVGASLIAVVVIDTISRNSTPPAAPLVTGAPALQVDKEKIDFGNVTLGQTVEAKFEVTNVGDRPLQFTGTPYVQVVEGCWPPTPTIGTMVLNPGEKTTLSMQFMMHGDMGGKHNFSVHVPTNDPKQADKTLTVLSNWVQWQDIINNMTKVPQAPDDSNSPTLITAHAPDSECPARVPRYNR